ncbi:MAG: hypothetical protein AB1505_12415 [Candidatus Latescibacterota bacterium]
MNTIIAAVIGGIVLLWGGILGALRAVDVLERRHAVLLGAYATLVTGAVMALVLYTNYERQKQHRAELQTEMEEFSQRLSQLSERLVAQLEEKADLTASEFEVRAQLQHERESHGRTAAALDRKQTEYGELKQTLDQQLAQQRQYQAQVDQQLQQRAAAEDQRYRGLQQLVETQGRTLQGTQKEVAAVQEGVGRLQGQTTSLVSKADASLHLLETRTQDINQKIETLARNQATLQAGLGTVGGRVDSLYKWAKD